MAKNIVICLDGTGNQFKEHNSNIVKLYRVLVKNRDQQAYYDAGVGTLADPQYKTPIKKRLNKALGLAFGYGIIRNVEEAYQYLMAHYQPGDRVFIFGFSRGAYTARVLAGLLHACGLLEDGNQSLLPYAMKLYRSGKRRFWLFGKKQSPDFRVLAKFKKTFCRPVDIHFLGLFDAVSTFGFIYSPTFLPFTTNNPSVNTIRHAMAIDEKRSFFQPMPWGDRHADRQDIKEVWFAGVHSDVGGGYPEAESQLAKIALKWMLDQATSAEHRLQVDDNAVQRYVLGKQGGGYIGPDHRADHHQSLKGAWWLAQYIPRSVWLVEEKKTGIRFPKQKRDIPAGEALHQSVYDRIADTDYAPVNLGEGSVEVLKEKYAIEPDA
ncbi:MAG: DUF2235 domain-containing protein [Wenzhouxiangellaceae bacterium]